MEEFKQEILSLCTTKTRKEYFKVVLERPEADDLSDILCDFNDWFFLPKTFYKAGKYYITLFFKYDEDRLLFVLRSPTETMTINE